MKMSRACSGMLSCRMMIQILKNCKKHKMYAHHVHHSSRARVTILSLETSVSLTRNTNVTVAKELHYIFLKRSKFRYWQLFIDAEYM